MKCSKAEEGFLLMDALLSLIILSITGIVIITCLLDAASVVLRTERGIEQAILNSSIQAVSFYTSHE